MHSQFVCIRSWRVYVCVCACPCVRAMRSLACIFVIHYTCAFVFVFVCKVCFCVHLSVLYMSLLPEQSCNDIYDCFCFCIFAILYALNVRALVHYFSVRLSGNLLTDDEARPHTPSRFSEGTGGHDQYNAPSHKLSGSSSSPCTFLYTELQ